MGLLLYRLVIWLKSLLLCLALDQLVIYDRRNHVKLEVMKTTSLVVCITWGLNLVIDHRANPTKKELRA